MRFSIVIAALAFVGASLAAADDEPRPSAAETEFFESKIRPVFVKHCYECHAADAKTLRGGLRVDTREAIRAGGDSGPAVVPGNVAESLLLEAIRYESFEMPPKGKLPEEVIADFVKWVEMGAPDPRDGTAQAAAPTGIDLERGREFWSFQPLSSAEPPAVSNADWPREAIDQFILARLEDQGLAPVADASPRALYRRLSFDLIGLPPKPEEIEAFAADPSDEAIRAAVERWLDSPHFGERWGRHWLDIARYANSTGGGRSLLYGQAWRYRDYVIDAFNQGKPFDDFIREQIAGDLLPHEDYQQAREKLTATAFLALGPTNYELQDKEQLRMDVIDEQIDTIGRAFLGMTIGCARCHDHKFDPIPTADYYALAGIFRSTQTLVHDNVSRWVERPLPADPETRAKLDAHTTAIQTLQARIDSVQGQLQQLRGKFPVITVDDTAAKFTGSWSDSSGVKEFVGESYRYASSPGAAVTYSVDVKNPGRYEVRVSYSAHGNRSPNALVRVTHRDGTADVRVNQTEPPAIEGLYASVGQYEFGFGPQTVSVSTEGTTGTVIADAVQFVPLFRASAGATGRIVADPASLPGIVVDNTSAELTGDWKDSTYHKSFVGAGYIHDDRMGKGDKQVVFSAELPETGEYDVRLSYTPGDSRASRVPVTITVPGGEETVYLDQRREPDVDGLFGRLGRFRFNNDQTAVVTVYTAGTDDGYVTIDAVQFLPVRETAAVAATAEEAHSTDDNDDVLAQLQDAETQLAALNAEMEQLKKDAPPKLPDIVSVRDEANEVGDYHICIRGNAHNLGEPVPRGFLQVVSMEQPSIPADVSGRLELANWIASPENPLTARVIANRVCAYLFGVGLVRTVDNFGKTGETPSHPELLDYLAGRLIASGWSIKSLIREIVASRTYQLAAVRDEALVRADPENRLLGRQNHRRLDAEAIYDSILSLSGQLHLDRAGGDTIRSGTKSEYGYEFDIGTRAVYLPVFRNQLPDLFSVFDFPDPNLSLGRRTTSTLSTQALFLMNSPFVTEQARFAAERMLAIETDTAGRIDTLYLRALGRHPTDAEHALALAHCGRADDDSQQLQAWAGLCQAVMASVDFRYLE